MSKYQLEVRYFDKPLYKGEPSRVVIESFDTVLGFTVQGCGDDYESALKDFKDILGYHYKNHQEDLDIKEARQNARLVLEEVEL